MSQWGTCELCGRRFERRQGKGRPRKYCPPPRTCSEKAWNSGTVGGKRRKPDPRV